MNRRDAIRALIAMPAVASIAKVNLQPSDVIVFECDHILTPGAVQYLQESAKRIWPNNKAIVCEHGLRLKVVRSEGA